MKILRIFVLYLVFISLTACAASNGPFSGLVLESNSRKPIPDVHVLVDWDGKVSAFVDSQNVCVHAEATITDQQGRFSTKAWFEQSKHGEGMTSVTPTMEPYKPGYSVSYSSKEWAKDYKQGILLMEPYKGTNQERLHYLEELASRVQCYGTDEKSLFQMLRAIYLEAKTLAVSDDDRLKVRGLRASAAEAWLGGNGVDLGLYAIEALIQKDNYLSAQLK